MKVGDLVHLKDNAGFGEKKLGVIIELSEPTLMHSYQVATIVFDDGVYKGISTRAMELVNENR